MGIFFKKKESINEKELRDSILKILESINRDNLIEKTIKNTKTYKDNKSLIDKTVKEWDLYDNDNLDGSNIYPKTAISEYIKILKYVEDGNIKEIGDMIRNSKKVSGDTILMTEYKKATFKILEFPASTDDYKTEEKWTEIRNEMYPVLDSLVDTLDKKYSNEIFSIEKATHHVTGNFIIKIVKK